MTDPLSLLLAPMLLIQGLWVRMRTPRLPEAPGARKGELGSGRPLSLLILGDSAAAGVGIEHQSKALAGHLSQELAQGYRLNWRLQAMSGITTAQAHSLLDPLTDDSFDVALLSLGVNDVLKVTTTPKAWQQELDRLCQRLKRRGALILVTELPPMALFTRLPQPLRRQLGQRTDKFNERLRDWAQDQAGLALIQLEKPEEGAAMAPDGFHPGEGVHRQWAAKAADVIRAREGV